MDQEVIEYVLLQKREVMAYEVPPSIRSGGHIAQEWQTQIFKGKLRIVAQGNLAIIALITLDDQVFCTCPVDPANIEQTVERVQDSSRYFVLKIIGPQGQHAFIGLGFMERNDAFDFYATLLDFQEREKAEGEHNQHPEPDMSHLKLQEGQTLSLSSNQEQQQKAQQSGGLRGLKPPPRRN